MTDTAARTQEILAALLARERTPKERLGSLAALQEFLADQEVALMLAGMARTEETTEVRSAMVAALLSADVTRFTRTGEYLDHLMFFALDDPEGSIRQAALAGLVPLAASDDRIQEVFSETLISDLDGKIQGTCLAGLARCSRKTENTVRALMAFAAAAPPDLREPLLEIFYQLERPRAEEGMLLLLHPLESAAVRKSILERFLAFPVLSGAAARHLVSHFRQEPDAALRELVTRILSNAVQADTGLMDAVLAEIRASPDSRALLYAFRDRLFSLPGITDSLGTLFSTTASSSLKIDILRLMEGTERIPLFTAALSDPGVWVRFEAIRICGRYLPSHPAAISAAVIARIPQEPLPGIRELLVRIPGSAGRMLPEAERFLLQWMVREKSPLIAQEIAAALPGIVMTDENRQDLLAAYVAVLRGPAYPQNVKDAITARLSAFSFRDEPDLAECLKALLVRATDIRTVETLHDDLRTLEPDFGRNVELFRLLFLRFIGEYPAGPLHSWVRDFEALAPVNEAVRQELPYISRITGETWILGAADLQDRKDTLLQAILDALYRGTFHEPERLLQEAYETRALRKRDLSALFVRLLDHHDQYRLLDDVLRILEKERISSPEILDAAFRFLTLFPDSSAAYGVREYLAHTGPLDPSFSDRIRNAATMENYRAYCLNNSSPRDENHVPLYWDDSGHWRVAYPDWPVAALLAMPALAETRRQILLLPPDPAVPVRESLQYLLLYNIWQAGTGGAEDLAAVGSVIRSAAAVPGYEPLAERAEFTFSSGWPDFISGLKPGAVPAELAVPAAHAYAGQCRRWQELPATDPRLVPMPLTGMDLGAFDAAWDPGDAVRDRLWFSLGTWFDAPEQARPVIRLQEPPVNRRLLFFPLSDPYNLISFLVRTPIPPGPAWERRWRDLLQKVSRSRQYGPALAMEIARVPGSLHERLHSFLK